MSHAQMELLVDFVTSSRKVLVLTGAGLSTESGIPDYRSPKGAYSTGFKPMTHQQFMSGPEARARYWARSFAGWPAFSTLLPNDGHVGLSRLQGRGWVSQGVITQNVDRLHQRAGSAHVLELHGTTHEVVCMGCGALTTRQAMQDLLAALNPLAAEHLRSMGAASAAQPQQQPSNLVPLRRPDGDVELVDAGAHFRVLPCSACGGVLKPHVVFFGDNLPHARTAHSLQLAAECDCLLAVGTSLTVRSALRLVETAARSGAKLAAINIGVTRADPLMHARVEARAGEVLMRLASHPQLLLPRT